MTTSLGQRIREARKAAGFKNVEGLAVALKVGGRTVQRWESGETDPSVARLIQIARVTKHPLSFFISEKVAA